MLISSRRIRTWLGSSGVDYFIDEEILLDLTDIIRTSCPNYWKLVNSTEEIRRQAVTDAGRFAEFYKVNDQRPECYMGYYVAYIESQGLAEITAAYQAAHDRYLAR